MPMLAPIRSFSPAISNGLCMPPMMCRADVRRFRKTAHRWEDDDELIPAEPGEQIVVARHFLKPLGDGGKQLVPNGVSQRVVDLLEVVQIDEQEGAAFPRFEAQQQSFALVVERLAIWKAGQSIERGQRLDRSLGVALLRDVFNQDDGAAFIHRFKCEFQIEIVDRLGIERGKADATQPKRRISRPSCSMCFGSTVDVRRMRRITRLAGSPATIFAPSSSELRLLTTTNWPLASNINSPCGMLFRAASKRTAFSRALRSDRTRWMSMRRNRLEIETMPMKKGASASGIIAMSGAPRDQQGRRQRYRRRHDLRQHQRPHRKISPGNASKIADRDRESSATARAVVRQREHQ